MINPDSIRDVIITLSNGEETHGYYWAGGDRWWSFFGSYFVAWKSIVVSENGESVRKDKATVVSWEEIDE